MLEFFFDVSSPFTYLAFHNIRPMTAELGVSIVWRPILVGGIFNRMNPSVQAQRDVPEKFAYLRKDLRDWGKLAGLRIEVPELFPVNSVKAMRGCILFDRKGDLVEFADSVFASYWSRGEDISNDDVLAPIIDRCGMSAQEFFEGISQPDVKAELRSNTEELMARGGFGTPTIFVNKSDMYFGNDRLHLVRNALQSAGASPGPA